MLSKKPIRRNSVVAYKTGGHMFYGRVIRVLPNGDIFWLCCGLHFHITKPEDLDNLAYRGRYRPKGHWLPMTSLRSLKLQAKRYHYEYAHNTPLNYAFIRRVA